jgi:hypothetical protein
MQRTSPAIAGAPRKHQPDLPQVLAHLPTIDMPDVDFVAPMAISASLTLKGAASRSGQFCSAGLARPQGEVMSTINSKTKLLASDLKLISGIQTHLQNGPSIQIDGTLYTIPQLVSELQERVTAFQATIAARTAWQNAINQENSRVAETKAFVSALRQMLRLMFASSITTLADLGVPPRKPRKADPLTRVVAAEKLRATRKARNTMSKKQKAKIRGTVPTTLALTVPATPGNAPSISPVEDPMASEAGAASHRVA